MTRMIASYRFDIDTLDMHSLADGDSTFYDNVNERYNGVVYQDVVLVETDYRETYFGGTGFVVDSSGRVTGGTVTGVLEYGYTGSAWSPLWFLQNFSWSAAAMYNAVMSASTADDQQIIAGILAGNDTLEGSAGNDTVQSSISYTLGANGWPPKRSPTSRTAPTRSASARPASAWATATPWSKAPRPWPVPAASRPARNWSS